LLTDPHGIDDPGSQNGDGVVIIENVSKAFSGTRDREALPVLQSISLRVESGEFVAVIGPSGCGKSTLLSIIAGYTSWDTGAVRVGRQSIKGPGPDRVMVFQQPTLFPWLSAANNISFGLRLKANRGVARDVNRVSVAHQFLELVGLKDFGTHYPFELSGGMQQRIEIARALAVHPKVLLMDEPFGALDALTRRSMQEELALIHEKTRCTIMFVTHDVYEAIALADRIVVMSDRPARIREIVRIDFDLAIERAQRALVRRDSVEATKVARYISSLLETEGRAH
jgi:NitT/TauT family transport system ATP-binding protein